VPRITPTVSDRAKQIYESIETVRQRGHFVSQAIIEKWQRENGEPFTKEQIEWLEKHFEKKV
jgi:hypothetical protein